MTLLFWRKKKRARKESPNDPNTQQTLASHPAAAEISSTFDDAKNTDSLNNESQRTMAAPQTTSVVAGTSVSVFSNSRDIHITGNPSFHTAPVISTSNEPLYRALDNELRNRAAPNAILNARGRADEVRCHPGTREEVISRIETWANAQDGQTVPVFWLSGPAGAGKSAIVQTIAKRCNAITIPQANFFFFRNDPLRKHASPLIPTLLYQITLLYPSVRDKVATALSVETFLFDTGTQEDQLEKLIVAPLRSAPELSSPSRPLLLLIDGLDECDSESKSSQAEILRAFDQGLLQNSGACPFRVLVASRTEYQIRVAFKKLSSKYVHLYLSDEFSPENDIRTFVKAQFDEIKKTRSLEDIHDVGWPSDSDIEYIVKKSSGQFIYAAAVMRFISGSSASPIVSLERVQGVTQRTEESPFSDLDATYAYILSQADDKDALKDILSTHLLLEEVQRSHEQHYPPHHDVIRYDRGQTFMELMSYLNPRYSNGIIRSCLGGLTSLMTRDKPGKLELYHASFSDYLSDQTRSGDYFIDTTAFSYKLLPKIWEVTGDVWRHREFWIVFSLEVMTRLPKLPAGIMRSLVSSMERTGTVIEDFSGLMPILGEIRNLCICNDDIVDFKDFLGLVSKEPDKGCPTPSQQLIAPQIKAMLQLGDADMQ